MPGRRDGHKRTGRTLTGSGRPRGIVATSTAARSPHRLSASVLPPWGGTIPGVAPSHHGRGGPMIRLILAASLLLATACEAPREVAAPARPASPRLQASLVDPALAAALAGAVPTATLEIIVNYDEAVTTRDAVSNAMLNLGAGVVQFKHLELVAGVATPTQISAIAALPGVQGVYLNRQLQYYGHGSGLYALMLHESIPTIRADAVHAMGITGKGMGIAILDSGIDGLYNPDLVYPSHTVQNVKVIFNLSDVVTFGKSAPKPLKQGVDIFAENLPNSETSVGHGSHVAGITAGLGTASGGYYTGVAPGASLVGIGDVLFIFFALAGFDYILDHQAAYNIKVVNNSWGTSGAFDPKDPINKASKTVHNHGITVVFAAGNDGPDQNTLNPYSVAPWVIGVAAGCKLVSPDPTNSAIHCDDPTGQNRAPILADFSSRGIPGDKLYHPDITAPGVHIVSTRASTGTVLKDSDANHDLNLTSTCAIDLANQPYYTCASGTSMATPHVAGVVALLQEAAGGTLSPDQVAMAITQTARPLPTFAECEVGAGYLDALAAVMAVKQ